MRQCNDNKAAATVNDEDKVAKSVAAYACLHNEETADLTTNNLIGTAQVATIITYMILILPLHLIATVDIAVAIVLCTFIILLREGES
eukprot:scaffold10051_cov94-Skeletonema_dohrnii-CCMP3373.AAC.2